jgi:hypothetical protein
MINIEIKDFQAIEHLDLCIDRVTAIVGGSNIGKSSVVRALKCALTNSTGTAFVRHSLQCARVLKGSKTCKCQSSVHIVMEDFDLFWEKGDAVNRYTFNKKVYDKPGQGIPEFLVDKGFSPVKIGDTLGSIQVADQFFPIFLLNQSGPAVAEAISDVSRLDRINRAAKAAEKDRKEAASTKKLREEDAVTLRVRLQQYEGLDEAVLRVSKVESQSSEVEAAESSVVALEGYIASTSQLTKKIRDLKVVSSVSVPALGLIQDPHLRVKSLTRFSEELERREADCKTLEWVDVFSEKVPDIDSLKSKLLSIQRLEGLITKARKLKEKFKTLEAANKSTPPSIDEIATLHSTVVAMSRFSSRLATLSNSVTTLTSEFDSYSDQERKLEAEVAELGVCPTCVQPLSLGHQHLEARHA